MEKKEPTKIRIILAMEQLMQQTSYEDITISQITDLCNVSRQVFYKYYSDKYDLCQKMLDHFYNDGIQKYDTLTWEDFVRHHLSRIQSHLHFYRKLSSANNGLTFFQAQNDFVCRIYCDMITSVQKTQPDTHLLFLLKSYCAGGFWMLREMLYHNKLFSIDELILLYKESMPAPLRDILIGDIEPRVFVRQQIPSLR